MDRLRKIKRSDRLRDVRTAFQVIPFLFLALFLAGCASTQAPSSFNPKSVNEVRFRDRSESKFDREVRVTTAVPTAEEAEEIFGANLAHRQIQPIWIKVENHSEKNHYLVFAGVDPNYYSPIEASYAVHGGLSKSAQSELENHFRSLHFRNPVLPHTAVSGFIFTNLDEGEKVVQVDLVGEQKVKFFTFFVQIPGMRVDYRRVDFDRLYPAEELTNLTQDALKEALEELPCCTTNKEGTASGDPLNLVIVGSFHDVAAAFARRGWLPAEETYSTAVWKTIKSFMFGSRYRYSPVSPLYLYGRHQDFARQKPRHNIHERNHLRLWYTPMRFEGNPVFVGQISRDIGVRFTTQAWPPVTHKIDPDADEARQSLIEDLFLANTISRIGFVRGVGPATPSKPRKNLTGDPYFTDGLRAVIILDPGFNPLDRIRSLGWEKPSAFRFDALAAD